MEESRLTTLTVPYSQKCTATLQLLTFIVTLGHSRGPVSQMGQSSTHSRIGQYQQINLLHPLVACSWTLLMPERGARLNEPSCCLIRYSTQAPSLQRPLDSLLLVPTLVSLNEEHWARAWLRTFCPSYSKGWPSTCKQIISEISNTCSVMQMHNMVMRLECHFSNMASNTANT